MSPNLTLNLGLRYDIMKPYTEVYDRWSFMNPDLPNPAVGGYRGAVQFAGNGHELLQLPNADQDATMGESDRGSASPTASTTATVLRASYGINYSRRGAVGGRAGARNGTGTLGFSANASFPSPNGFDPSYNWNNGVPAYPPPPFFDPTLNAGFVTGRGTGGSVTFGDAEIGGRPPRYQNFNAGFQRALAKLITVGASYAGSRGDFLGGSGRGFYSNQLDPQFLVLGNLLTQQATPANIAAAQAIVSGVAVPYPNFSGTISQMLRPFPQYSGVTDVYGNVAWSTYDSLQLTLEKRRTDDGLDRELQLHLQPHRRQPGGANGLQLRSGLGGRRQRSAARVERVRGLRDAVWRAWQARERQSVRQRDREGLADLRHHAVQVGQAAWRDWGRLQLAECRHVLR